jgi:hypothetical protein
MRSPFRPAPMFAALLCLVFSIPFRADAQSSGKPPKMVTEIPPDITTPNSVDTSLGTLKFVDGLPDKDTVTKVYDNLDLIRGVDAFLNTMSAASLHANIVGLKSVGANNQTVVIHEQRVDAKTLLLTPNTQTATLWAWLNVKDGPTVLEIPPSLLGLVDDAWMRTSPTWGSPVPIKAKAANIFSCLRGTRALSLTVISSCVRRPITCGSAFADSP